MAGALELHVVPGRACHATTGGESVVTALIKLLPAPVVPARLPLHVMLLVERGPEMDRERRLELAQQAARTIVDALGPDDQIGLAAYGERGKLILPLEPRGDGAKARRLIGFLDTHALGPGANVLQGLKAVADDMRAAASPAQVRRTILFAAGPSPAASDRDAELLGIAMAEEGQQFSIFGLGPDWNGPLLSRLADAGRGNVWHAPRVADVPAAARREADHLAAQGLGDVRLRLRFAKGVRLRRLVQAFPAIAHWLPTQPGEREALVRVGALRVDRPCHLLAELVVPAHGEGTFRLAQLEATFLEPDGGMARCVPTDLVAAFGPEALPLAPEVKQPYEAFQAFSLVERALEARREHDLPRAKALLENARRIVPLGRATNELDAPLSLAIGALERGLPLTEGLAKALFVAARAPEGSEI